MEIREAIERIKDHKRIHFVEEYPRAIKITEALDMAIDALEVQDSCVLCKNDKNFKINFISGMNCSSTHAVFDLGRLDQVEYCPKCGRKLRS